MLREKIHTHLNDRAIEDLAAARLREKENRARDAAAFKALKKREQDAREEEEKKRDMAADFESAIEQTGKSKFLETIKDVFTTVTSLIGSNYFVPAPSISPAPPPQ